MIGEAAADASAVVAEGSAAPREATDPNAPFALEVEGLAAVGDRGTLAVQGLTLKVRRGEILGIAAVINPASYRRERRITKINPDALRSPRTSPPNT